MKIGKYHVFVVDKMATAYAIKRILRGDPCVWLDEEKDSKLLAYLDGESYIARKPKRKHGAGRPERGAGEGFQDGQTIGAGGVS